MCDLNRRRLIQIDVTVDLPQYYRLTLSMYLHGRLKLYTLSNLSNDAGTRRKSFACSGPLEAVQTAPRVRPVMGYRFQPLLYIENFIKP